MLADGLLVVHFLIAGFVAAGLPAVWVGAALGWAWVRNPAWRYLHLGAILFIAAEALVGMACPLTMWEDLLRASEGPGSFVGRWVQRLLYYHAPAWAFTAAYAAWAAATLLTLALVPPRRRAG